MVIICVQHHAISALQRFGDYTYLHFLDSPGYRSFPSYRSRRYQLWTNMQGNPAVSHR